MKRTFLWLRKWLWYNQSMQKDRAAIVLIILCFVATVALAFWLGRQSVQPMQVGPATVSNESFSDATSAPSAAGQITAPETEAVASNGSPDSQPAETASQTSGQSVERSIEQEQLLSDIELAGIEPDDLKVYLKAWELLNRDFYGEKPDTTKQLYSAIRGLIQSYGEPYTFFIEPQTNEVEQGNLRGSFGGIGAYVEPSDLGPILRPMRDQPAAKAGIEENDRLTVIDDVEILADTPIDEVVALIRGPVDTEVQLTVLRTSQPITDTDVTLAETLGEELSFTIMRARIQTPSMDWRTLSADEFPESLWQDPQNLNRIDQIGYIRHHTFSDRTPTEMRTALAELTKSGADSFILDLRGNPGGPVTAVVKTVDLWLDDGDIMREVNAQGEEQIFVATPDVAVDEDVPLIIIVDGGSASASEILAGALNDQNRAKLLGEKTFGKGSVQIIYPLPDDSSVHITNATWFTPNGYEINGQGLQPDIPIEAGTDPIPQAIGALLDLTWNQ